VGAKKGGILTQLFSKKANRMGRLTGYWATFSIMGHLLFSCRPSGHTTPLLLAGRNSLGAVLVRPRAITGDTLGISAVWGVSLRWAFVSPSSQLK